MRLVDTNIFIRYLIGDDPTKQHQSRDLIERIPMGKEDVFTTSIVVHEICYVLSASTHYNLSHQDIRDRLFPMIAMEGLHMAEKSLCLEALNLFAMGEKVDFSDAFSAAYVRNGLVDGIYSFDRKLDNLPGSGRVLP
ncbi:MAG TPA: PIN domain-containing protein [Chloroflexota bacterium]|nr:PIN domain-containing protein [Chloroflexota bacterium]